MDDVIKTGTCPQLVFQGNVTVDYTQGASHEMTSQLGKLEFEDGYEEKYMVAYSIDPNWNSALPGEYNVHE